MKDQTLAEIVSTYPSIRSAAVALGMGRTTLSKKLKEEASEKQVAKPTESSSTKDSHLMALKVALASNSSISKIAFDYGYEAREIAEFICYLAEEIAE